MQFIDIPMLAIMQAQIWGNQMTNKHDYEAYVQEALNQPGTVSACYSAFWNYSTGNQFLARLQLEQPEPINTYKGWQSLGRQVKKGSKAIELLMPVTIKDKDDETKKKMIFVSRRNWFGISQTEGAEYVAPAIPGFDFDNVLSALGITVEPFKMVNGNCQGYARTDQQTIAINPVAANPEKTMLHEIAHCLLHADAGALNDAETLQRDVKEVEAELTAYIVQAALGRTEKLSDSRGYIQNWMRDTTAEKVRFGKVFGAVDKILKAGRPEQTEAIAA